MRKEKLKELKSYIEELKTIQILDQRKLTTPSHTPEKTFLEIEKIICQLGNGKVIAREKILKNKSNGSAAIVLPITKEGNTILVVQPRVFTKSTVGIELPAGYIEKGEKPIAAARRELIEETGYIPEKLEPLAQYYQDQGISSSYNHSFLAINYEKRQSQTLDESEFIRYFECTYEEVLELAEKGYINDANSLLALEKSKKLLRRKKDKYV